ALSYSPPRSRPPARRRANTSPMRRTRTRSGPPSTRPTGPPPIARSTPAGGYTTELLARVVGPKGVVYGQNNRLILDRFAAKPWTERLGKWELRNVMRVDREFDDPLPPEAHDLDAVLLILFYHDTVWMGVDRAHMNAAVFRALRPGG